MVNIGEVEKFRSIAELVVEKWRLLHLRAALLEPTLLKKEVVESFSLAGKAFGFDGIRMALLDAVILGAASILYSADKNDASINNLLRAIRDPHSELYRYFKNEYSNPLSNGEFLENSDLTEDVKKQIIEGFEKKERVRKQQLFDKYSADLIKKYDALMRAGGVGNKLKNIRNKVVAHFATKHHDGKRKLREYNEYSLKIKELFESINGIEEIVTKSALLICNVSWILDHTKQHHTNESASYWSS